MISIKPILQTTSYCGPACLQMVGNYYGIKKSQKEWARLAQTTLKKGTSVQGLLRAARMSKMNAKMHVHVSWSDLRKWLNQNVPVIVNWFSTDEGHYSVVIGLSKTFIHLADPEVGKIVRMKRNTFLRGWKKRARKAFVICLPEQ